MSFLWQIFSSGGVPAPPFAIICILHIRSNCFEMLCGREIHFWASWKEARKHQEKKERPIMHDYLKYYIFSYEGELIAKRWWRHAKLSSSSEWKSAYLPQIILPLLSVLWLIPSASTRLQVRNRVPSFVLSSNSQTRSIPISIYIYIYTPGFQLHTQYPPNTRRHASCATSCCQQQAQGPKTKIVV
jgi:hypothetical protein